MEESKDVEMEDQQYGWDKKMDKEAALLKASIQDGEPDDGKALFTINDEDDDGRGPPIVASLQWTDEDIEYEYGALEEFGPKRLCDVYGADIAALRLKNMRPFSLVNLENLLRSIFGEVKVADMLEGLSRAGAKETTARILITVQKYGGADLTMKQLLNVPESRVLPQARLTCMLLGTVRKKGEAPTHAEMKLHRFLYLKKQELEALGMDYGLGMREAAVFLRRKPAFAYQIPDRRARIGQEALADLAKYGNVWSEYLASQVDLTPTQWVDWNMDPRDQGDGVSRFNPRKYLEYVQAAANIAMADRTAKLLAEEGKAGKEGMIPGVNRVMWEEQHLKLFPNAKWVNALMNSSIRPGLYDDASLQRISALPANWRPEIRSALTFLGSLENVTMAMDQACKMLNKMPMFHPHLPYVFAMIVKIRNYLRPLFQAVQEYGLGTKAFELVDCPREWKQPFMSTAGERPDFFPRTLVEIIRAHASAIAVVGTNEEKASLAYSPVTDYQRTVSGEKDAGQMIAEQILEESIPDRCYRLVKIVEEQGEKVFLQLAIHPTEPVISSRNVITVTGGFPRAFGMTEEQLSDLQTRFVKGEEGTLRNAVTECLNLSAEGKRNPRHPRIPSMLALSRETREKIADCVPKRDLFLDLEQAICRINALQSEVEALRDLEREGPMSEERARGLREAAREPTEVDRHNPFEGALWDEADQISRIKERYESRIDEMREEYQQLQNKITEMEAENIKYQARIAELIQEQRDSADRELSPGEEEQMRKIVDSRVSKIIEEQQGEIDRQHREELARCDAASGGLREQVKSMEATVEAQRKELEELRKKAKGKPTVSFKEGVDESESERLREEVKSAKRKIASLKTELDEKSESLKQAKTEAGKTEEARKSASQTEEELAKTKDMLATVKAELQKTKETKEADQKKWVDTKREMTEKLREAEMKVSKAERELKARDKLENELREKIANSSTTTQGGKATPKQPDTGALNKEIEQLKREKKGLGEKLDAKSEEFDKYKRETERKATFADGIKENLEHQIIEIRRASKRDAKEAEEKKKSLEEELSKSYLKVESLERQINEMRKKRDSGPTDEEEKGARAAPAETAQKPEEEKKKPDEPDTAGNSDNQPDKRGSEPMEVDDESAWVEREKEAKRDESSKPGADSAPDKSNQSGEASRAKPGEIFQDDQGTRWRRKDQASGSQSGGHSGPGPSGPSTGDADEEVVVRISVEAAGVLGLNSRGERVTGVGAYTAIVDPAGMNYIREGPRGAGAASGAIYEWLEAKDMKAFPKRIQAGIKRVTDAIFHRYREERNVIHAVGPVFRQIECDEEGAEAYLARTYANVFREALRAYNQFQETSKLRLLPISSGVFAGGFTREQMARITAGAIEKALKSLAQHRVKLLAELEITMCIYDPDQVKLYREMMASLSKGYVRRGEAPEPLPDTDGGSKRKREESQPPQAMEEEEEEEVLEMPPHVHPSGDYETEFTRSVSVEERCAKAAEGNYTMMQVEGSSLRDEVNLDIPQSEGTESRPSAQDATKQNNVIEADVYNPHRIEKTNAKEVTRDDMWSECPMVDDLIQAEELQKVMKIKGWDIGLSDNDRKKGHDEIIKSGLQVGPYRTAYEEIHPDAHGVVNVDDEGRRRLKRMLIGQARINRAVLTDGPKFQGGEEDATERASQFDEGTTSQLRDATGEELERMKRALERESIIPQNYPIESTKTLREHYGDILSPLATELRSSLGMPTINPQVVREQIEKAEREFIIGWTGASRNELGIPQYMAHGHERTHTLEGAQEQDKRKRYPVEVIRRLARNVADIVGHGYEEMKDSAEGRRTQKQTPLTRSVSTFDPYFLKCDSHAVPWSWVRQKVEERCGYTIRDLEEKEIAYYAQTYGTEVLGSLGMCKGENKDGEVELRPGVARVVAMRPAGVIGAISVVQGTTRSTREDRLTPPNGHQAKGVWRDIELEELPKVAYYTMSVGEWVKMMSGAVAIAPASGDENVILEWYPEGSRSRGIRGWIPYSPPWMKRDYDTGNPESIHHRSLRSAMNWTCCNRYGWTMRNTGDTRMWCSHCASWRTGAEG